MFQGTVSQLVEKYRFRLMMTVMVALLDHAAADFAVVVDSPDGLAVGFDNRAVFGAAADLLPCCLLDAEGTVGFAAEYATPLEQFLSNQVCVRKSG